MSGDIFVCHNLGEGTSKWVEAREECCETSYNAQDNASNKGLSTQNVSRAGVQKSWSRPWLPAFTPFCSLKFLGLFWGPQNF